MRKRRMFAPTLVRIAIVRLQKLQETAVAKPQETINAWSVGLAGGLLEGAPIRFAAEVAQR